MICVYRKKLKAGLKSCGHFEKTGEKTIRFEGSNLFFREYLSDGSGRRFSIKLLQFVQSFSSLFFFSLGFLYVCKDDRIFCGLNGEFRQMYVLLMEGNFDPRSENLTSFLFILFQSFPLESGLYIYIRKGRSKKLDLDLTFYKTADSIKFPRFSFEKGFNKPLRIFAIKFSHK